MGVKLGESPFDHTLSLEPRFQRSTPVSESTEVIVSYFVRAANIDDPTGGGWHG